jgi:DNA polymerase III epsilon subunit-like protein
MAAVLVIDTETTGFSPNNDDVIQAAWVVYAADGTKLKLRNKYIKTNLNIRNSWVHGITNELLNRKGANFAEVIELLKHDIAQYGVRTIIGHNLKFDMRMLIGNCVRRNIDHGELLLTNTYCTMEKAKQQYGKNYKLIDLYRNLFNREFDNQHNAKSDILATSEIYYRLVAAM